VPGSVLNLDNWKVQLPTGTDGSPRQVKPPDLQTLDASPWFTTDSDCSAVQFRSPVNGARTANTGYPRSELRELTADGSLASWSSDSGTHTMTIDEAITHLPETKPEVVAGQIHNGDDQATFRLSGTNLYVTNGDDSRYQLITDSYQLGTRFEARFTVSDDTIKAYYNGTLVATIDRSFTNGNFKAGVYTQANCVKSAPCSSSNYGETLIYQLTVSHD